MANLFLKNYDDLLTEILTDFKNLDSAPDVSQGSITFIKGACLASALWGLYRYQDYLSRQIFPDSADTDNLNHWASIFGIARITDEADVDFAQRILGFLQSPPAGGTAQDYINWALASVPAPGIPANRAESFSPGVVNIGTNKITLDGVLNKYGWVNDDPVNFSTTGTLPSGLAGGGTFYAIKSSATEIQVSATSGGVAIALGTQGTGMHTITHATQAADPNIFYIRDAICVTPNDTISPTSPGTVNIVIVPSDESIVNPLDSYYAATWTLSEIARIYIDSKRPVTAYANLVSIETIVQYAIAINAGPLDCPVAQMQTDVQSYVNSLDPGQPLYESQLVAICLRDGATHAEVTSPTFVAGKITPAYSYEAIRYSTVSITPEV